MCRPSIIPQQIHFPDNMSVAPCRKVDVDTYKERLVAMQEANADTIDSINKMKSLIIKDNSFEISNYGKFKKSLSELILKTDIIQENQNLDIDSDTLLPLIFDSITIDDKDSSEVRVNQLVGFSTREELYSVNFSNLLKVTYISIPQLINNAVVFGTTMYAATSTDKPDVLQIIACLLGAAIDVLCNMTVELDGKKFIPVLKLLLTYDNAFKGISAKEVKNKLIETGIDSEEVNKTLKDMSDVKIIELSNSDLDNENTTLTLKEKITFVN